MRLGGAYPRSPQKLLDDELELVQVQNDEENEEQKEKFFTTLPAIFAPSQSSRLNPCSPSPQA